MADNRSNKHYRHLLKSSEKSLRRLAAKVEQETDPNTRAFYQDEISALQKRINKVRQEVADNTPDHEEYEPDEKIDRDRDRKARRFEKQRSYEDTPRGRYF